MDQNIFSKYHSLVEFKDLDCYCQYMLLHEGRQYARVTEILESFNDFGHIPPRILTEKALLGTNVHTAIDSYWGEEFFTLGAKERPYFESFLKWAADMCGCGIQVKEREKRYFDHNLMITGQIDLLAVMPYEEIPSLVDFKTSLNESPVWIMQAHLYHHLLKINNVQVNDSFYFIKLSPRGIRARVYKYTFDQNTLNKCLNAVDEYWEKNKTT